MKKTSNEFLCYVHAKEVFYDTLLRPSFVRKKVSNSERSVENSYVRIIKKRKKLSGQFIIICEKKCEKPLRQYSYSVASLFAFTTTFFLTFSRCSRENDIIPVSYEIVFETSAENTKSYSRAATAVL